MHSFFFASILSFSQFQYCDQYHRPKLTAGTAHSESIQIILAIAAELDLEIASFDVRTADKILHTSGNRDF